MSTAPPPPGQLKLTTEEVLSLRTSSTVTYALTLQDYYDSDVTAGNVRVFPVSGAPTPTDNRNGTWLFARPASGTAYLYNVQGTYSNYAAVTSKVRPLAQDATVLAGPALSVVGSDVSSYRSFAFTKTGTLTWFLDGSAQGDPGGTPLLVVKNAYGGLTQVVRFHCVGDDGSYLDYSETVLTLAQASGGALPGGMSTQTTPWGFDTQGHMDNATNLLELLRQDAVTRKVLT